MIAELKGVKAVVFDFDGTLYDKRKFPLWLILSGISDLFAVLAERVVRKKMKGMDLKTKEAFDQAFFTEMSVEQKCTIEEARDWYFEKYMPRFIQVLKKHYKPYPQVEAVFDAFRVLNIKTAVYSDYPLVKERMEAIGLSGSICDNYWSAPEFGAFKPAKRPMQEIAKRLDVACDQLLVIGDRADTDGLSAEVCGAKFLQINLPKAKVEVPGSLTWNAFADRLLSFARTNVLSDEELRECV